MNYLNNYEITVIKLLKLKEDYLKRNNVQSDDLDFRVFCDRYINYCVLMVKQSGKDKNRYTVVKGSYSNSRNELELQRRYVDDGVALIQNNKFIVTQDIKDLAYYGIKKMFRNKNPSSPRNINFITLENYIKNGFDAVVDDIEQIKDTLQVELNTHKESLTDEDDWGYDPSLIDTLEMEPVGFDIANMIYNLHLKLALLIRGVPGTGKTTTARNIADNITCKENQLFIQISPEYTYVDCIGGIKAVKGGWEDVRGVVYEFCKRAYKSWVISKKGNLDIEKFVIIIDEISKGNIEAIIGELSSAMEMRGVMVTTKDNKPFIVAPNVYIIATTNTSDMDGNNVRLSTSMMQRFFVYDILPQWTSDYIKILCKDVKDIKITGKLIEVAKLMTDVNNVIQNDYLLGIDKVIGTRMLLKEALTNTGLICNILPSINTQIDIIIKASGDSTKSKLIKLKDNIKNVLTSGDEV